MGGKIMNLIGLLSASLRPAGNLCRAFWKTKTRVFLLEGAKIGGIVLLSVFLSLEYFLSYAQSKTRPDPPGEKKEAPSLPASSRDPGVEEVLNLAGMIRFITDRQLPEGKALRYAGLISHGAQKYSLNPLEIIALIMAESRFQESSVNLKTGDYGLGQVNWNYWGKENGLTPQELLDPAINIYLTCHVYHFFGKDFGKYHRGNGVKSKAYIVNVKSILSTLHAFGELSPEEAS